MPLTFLSNDQLRRYGRYNDTPTEEQLAHHFYLSPSDLEWINTRRRPHNKLGFALQLCTLRFLGTFLPDPTAVPTNVVAYVARQLKIADLGCLNNYMVLPSQKGGFAHEVSHN